MASASSLCPRCGSQLTWRDGTRNVKDRVVQRHICRECSFRFSVKDSGKTVNRLVGHRFQRQICVSPERKAKNLVTVEPLKDGLAGATILSDAHSKGKIVDFAWWLKKEGYRVATIKTRTWFIKKLKALGADLRNSDSVKETIAKQETWSEGTKIIAVNAYSSFLSMFGATWTKPRYKFREKLPFIPMESELDALITACGKVTGAFLQGLKDTGADPGEFAQVEWTDITPQSRTVSIQHPVKGHSPRIVLVSNELLRRLGSLPKEGNRIFKGLRGLNSNYYRQRKRIALKLGNPRLGKICFTTFRHWKATMEYHKTKDIIHVKQLLGHKSIQNTMVYINLEQAIFKTENDEFHVRVAHSAEEACKLVEVGFDYVTGTYDDGGSIFRKHK